MLVMNDLIQMLGFAAAVRATFCDYQQKVDGIQHEIDTISTHSLNDANQIPLALNATRTFIITPSELSGAITLPPVNVGLTDSTVRAELVSLATVLQAAIPPDTVNYFDNANGSVTVDFVQTDAIVLPYVHVREIHYFDGDCNIYEILGYVHGPLECPQPASTNNTVIDLLCDTLAILDPILG